MRKLWVLFLLLWGVFLPGRVEAVDVVLIEEEVLESTSEASLAADIVVPVEEIKTDLTEPEESKPRLEQVLESQSVERVWPENFLKVAIRKAVTAGVPVNMFVLLLLFPLVTALVAFSRNVVGIKGFGIFTPAVVAVAFLSTGVVTGVLLFLVILLTATLSRRMLRKVRMQYFPRMSIMIWAVSMSVLGLLLLSPLVGLIDLQTVGIFPILLFILLADPFIDAQIHKSMRTAMMMAIETVVLALLAFLIVKSEWLQKMVLLQPEITMISSLLVNFLIGRYKGLRLMEVYRFKDLWKK